MKPRNFNGRKLRRQAIAKQNREEQLSGIELQSLCMPKDIRIRIGAKAR